MTINLLESADGGYLVLVNDEEQYSLWPQALTVPAGWTQAFADDSRERCLDYIEQHWVDMRPRNLRGGGT
jgi:MbtH protein